MSPASVPLVLGGNTFGWTSNRDDSFAVLDAFHDRGGTQVDTADVYSAWVEGNTGGESETVIGEWLRRRPGRPLSLATKVGRHPARQGLSRETVQAAADESLRRLGVDRIDVYYAHYDDPATPLAETAAAFHDLVVAGKVAEIGISNYPAERIREWMAIADSHGWKRPVWFQPHYNLVHREPFETTLAPVADEFGLRVVPYFALASGFLTGKYRRGDAPDPERERFTAPHRVESGYSVVEVLCEVAEELGAAPATVALAWLLSRPGVEAPIASARVPEQLDALLAVAELRLDAEQIRALDEVSAPARTAERGR